MSDVTPDHTGQTISVTTLLHIINLQRTVMDATTEPGTDLDSYHNALTDLTTLIHQYTTTEIK